MRIVLKAVTALLLGIVAALALDLAVDLALGLGGEGGAPLRTTGTVVASFVATKGRLALLVFLVCAPIMGYVAWRLVAGQEADADRREETLEHLRHAERISTVGRLASNLAHELGTPLNIVSGRAMMIAAGEVEGAESLESARVIVEQANRMTSYIRGVLNAARRSRPEKAPAQVQTVFEQVLAIHDRRARRTGVKLVLDEPRDEIVLEAFDATRLVQIVTHLVTNAIESMPHGGEVHLGVRREAEVSTRGEAASSTGYRVRNGKYVHIYVRDEGEGISKENLQAIFKPFFTTKGESGSAGLGLAIAQGIVREQGGWIDVESEVGAGSCFHVCLPEGG